MNKLILALIIVFSLSLSIVLADENTTGGIEISKLDVIVGSATDDKVENDTTISKDAKPSDKVEFKVELENLFDSDENCDDDNSNNKDECELEKVEIEITIKEIDDGDNLIEKTGRFEISEGNKKTENLTFEIPKIIKDGSYDVVILVKGNNAGNSSKYEVEWNLKLKVEKKKYDIRITNYGLIQTILECGELQTTLNIEIFNYGTKEEDEVVIEVKSSDLNINEKVQNIKLGKDFDKDARYEKDIPIIISEEFSVKGTYPLTLNLYRDNDELVNLVYQEVIDLEIKECSIEEPIIEDIIGNTDEEKNEEIENQEEQINNTAQPINIATMEIEEKDSSYVLPILGLFIITIIIIIMVLVILMKKE
jgi:hypothetical protein